MIESWENLWNEDLDEVGGLQVEASDRERSEPIVQICLTSLSGKCIDELDMESDMLIRAMKLVIEDRTGIPCECQELILNGTKLADGDSVRECAGENALELSATLVVCLSPLLDLIACSDKAERRKSIAKLQRFLAVGPQETLYLLDVNDPRPLVRREVLALLEQALLNQNPRAGVLLRACLDHSEDDVRIRAIRSLARCGDHNVADKVIGLLQDPQPLVREEALLALPALVDNGSPALIDAVIYLLGDLDAAVKHAAMHSLPKLSVPGEPRILERMSDWLRCPDPEIRRTALAVLSKTLQAGEQQLWDCVASCVEDRDMYVREEAWHTLTRLAASGGVDSEHAVQIIRHVRAESPEPAVRNEAVRSLIAIVPYLDEIEARDYLLELATSGDSFVLASLRGIHTSFITPCFVSAVARRLNSTDEGIKQTVAWLLGGHNIAKHNVKLARETLHALQHDPDAMVSGQATASLLGLQRLAAAV